MKKSSLRCPLCAQVFEHRVKRSWFLKHVVFFIPVRIYCCNTCQKNVYLILADKEAAVA